jgi:hypothetical protein
VTKQWCKFFFLRTRLSALVQFRLKEQDKKYLFISFSNNELVNRNGTVHQGCIM